MRKQGGTMVSFMSSHQRYVGDLAPLVNTSLLLRSLSSHNFSGFSNDFMTDTVVFECMGW
jgi:hypothetical protein